MSAAKIAKSMASPTRTQFFRNASTTAPKSILKRPAALPLSPSPFPFSASFNIMVSPSVGSPHVHFPNSASLAAMFSTHSPASYDRAAIVVSPNPLALPAWGERVYSPSTGSFKKDMPAQASPMLNKPVVSAVALGDNVVVMAPPKAKSAKAKSQARARAKFEENLANAQVLPRDTSLGRSIAQFPRSPYPSAPLSPSSGVTETAVETRRTQRAASVSGSTGTRKLKANRPAALGIAGSELSLAQNASPHRPSFLSPVAESPAAPLDSSRLSQDFWRSVSVSEEIAAEAQVAETPVSAVPRFMFGTKDGSLWSPGLPRKSESMLSPLSRTTFAPMTSDTILSPAPNDRVANYPSFGMVLSSAADTIKYPAPVITN